MLEAVIFDLDGVLINSVPSAQRVRKKLLAEYGVDFSALPDPDNEQHKGSSLKSLLAVVEKSYPNVHIDFQEIARKQTDGVLEDLRAHEISIEPALVRLLDDLTANNVAVAVASAGIREAVEGKLQLLGIRRYFNVIITATDVTEHKPHPASYLLALDRLHVKPENCIIFEDSTTGVEAGHAAGCKVIVFSQYSDSRTNMSNTLLTIDRWDKISYEELEDLAH